MEVGLKFKGKKFKLAVKKVSGFGKFIGLMFAGKNASALLFDFKKPGKYLIHSLFCSEFVGIWINEKGKIIEIKKISPWKFSIVPKREFVKLIEIPVGERYRDLVGELFE